MSAVPQWGLELPWLQWEAAVILPCYRPTQGLGICKFPVCLGKIIKWLCHAHASTFTHTLSPHTHTLSPHTHTHTQDLWMKSTEAETNRHLQAMLSLMRQVLSTRDTGVILMLAWCWGNAREEVPNEPPRRDERKDWGDAPLWLSLKSTQIHRRVSQWQFLIRHLILCANRHTHTHAHSASLHTPLMC
jgi:hypothetical protein